MMPFTDALAVQGVLATLSPGISADFAAINGIVAAASHFPENSLEVIADDLGVLLGTGAAPTSIARDLSDLTARDSYYQNLYAVLDKRDPGLDYGIVSLVGKTPDVLASMAMADVSVRYALENLMPFAARNADFSSFGDSFSHASLAARAEMLAGILENNLIDRPFGLAGNADSVIYRDIDSGVIFSLIDDFQYQTVLPMLSAPIYRQNLLEFLDGATYKRNVVFGSDARGDHLEGGSGRDRLFGRAGADRLEGGDGDDYLEGGAGDDELLGGAGADTLVGGEGADKLYGGSGMDTYIFEAGLDADTIDDRDGFIFAGTDQLTGGSGGEGGVFVSSDGSFRYALQGSTLVINGLLRIERFQDGDLGIHLKDGEGLQPVAHAPAGAQTVLLGDSVYRPFPLDPVTGLYPASQDEFGNPLPETRVGSAPGIVDGYDVFQGTPGATWFLVGGGDDIIQDLLGGDDRLVLGDGDDAGWGGTGNDAVEGGAGRDMVAGGRGDDFLYAGSAGNLAADLDDQAIGTGASSGDLLSGGDGDDSIYGDAGANLIEGGAGRDRIFGGAGDDWIGGDVAVLSARERYGIHPINNDWINRVVDVLWDYGPFPTFSLQSSASFGPPIDARINGIDLNSRAINALNGDADEIDAGAGNDTVMAGGGDDIVYGGDGNDYIDTGSGADTVFGGAGNDFMLGWRDSLGDYFDGGDGDDVASGGNGNNIFIGGAGNDQLYAGAGDDVLLGGAGNDFLGSSGGNDMLIGGAGDDFLGARGGSVLDGGAGNDRYGAGGESDQVVTIRMGRGYGQDALESRTSGVAVEMLGDVAPQDIEISLADRTIRARDSDQGEFEVLHGIELRIGSAADSLFLVDTQQGFPTAPLWVEFADGTVWDDAYIQSRLSPSGEPVEPAITLGTSDADLLYGTSGADTLTGFAGDDWLVGDSGDDTYVYAGGDGFDLIEDVDQSPGNTDVLRFADGIDPGDVSLFASGSDYILTAGTGGVRLRGGRTQEGAIERIEFADGTLWTPGYLEAHAELLPENRAPEMAASLGRISVDPGTHVEVSIPRDAISDPDRFDSLSVYAITADGEKLPDWLSFDSSTLTFSASPAAADAGPLELLLIAADSSGAASMASLTIAVGGDGAEAEPPVPSPAPAAETASADAPLATQVAAPTRSEALVLTDTPAARSAADLPPVGVPLDPLFRDMQQRFDVLLQTGRTNLGERYVEAVREFEERRQQREELLPPPPPPTDEEVAAWNGAMHNWHDRNPGFAETDLGGNDGTWTMGWGLPGPGERTLDGNPGVGTLLGLGNPNALARLSGAAAAPTLAEGLKDLR